MNASTHWQNQREGGSRLALWLICEVALRAGRPFGRLCLYPITLYFYLRRRPERQASRQYLERAFARPPSPWQVLRHLYSYAAVTLDRIFLLTRGERGFAIETEGVEELERILAQGRGALLIGSHQGSFEALRILAERRPELSLRVVLDKQKTPAMTELLEALAPEIGAKGIDASQGGAATTLAVAETCAQGGMAALLADRGRTHELLRSVPFLGRPAPFPAGPWLLAQAVRAPVLLCFGLYLGGARYRLIFEPFAERVEIPRGQRADALDAIIARYAQRLEHYVRVAPYNWFNFHDFWQEPDRPGQPAAAGVGGRCGA